MSLRQNGMNGHGSHQQQAFQQQQFHQQHVGDDGFFTSSVAVQHKVSLPSLLFFENTGLSVFLIFFVVHAGRLGSHRCP